MHQAARLLAWALLPFAAAAHAVTDGAPAPLAMGPHLTVGNGGVDPVIYDSTGTNFTVTSSTPRTYIGGAANIVGAGPQVDITSLDVFMVSTAATSYTNVRVRVQLWDTYTEGSSPVFSNAAGALITSDLGAITTAANSVYTITLNLAAPLRLNSLNAKGFAVNFQSDTGSGLADDTTLLNAMTYGSVQPVGTSAVNSGNGFYRNASNRTDFNFNSTDLRTFTGITDVRTALVLRGNASVPVTLQSYGVE